MSFLNALKFYIHQRGYVNLGELNVLTDKAGHKRSYMERLMRIACEGENASFKAVKNQKGYIVAYEVKNVPQVAKQNGKPLSWEEELRQNREKENIKRMTNSEGKIVACS